MMPVKGKAVVITGAASGIGAALAHALAAQGARLLLAEVDLERLEAVAQDVRAQGASCLAQESDVAQFSAMEALAERALRDLGGADVRLGDLMYRLFPARASAWFHSLARRGRRVQ